jgi:hypothetical protein
MHDPYSDQPLFYNHDQMATSHPTDQPLLSRRTNQRSHRPSKPFFRNKIQMISYPFVVPEQSGLQAEAQSLKRVSIHPQGTFQSS